MRLALLAASMVLLVSLVPVGAAAPSAQWKGTTSTFVCVDGFCHITSSPVDDESVVVGTGDFRQVKLTLTPPKGETLGLKLTIGKATQDLEPASSIRTGWLDVRQVDQVKAFVYQDGLPTTGVLAGVSFTLTATYR